MLLQQIRYIGPSTSGIAVTNERLQGTIRAHSTVGFELFEKKGM